MRAFKEDGRDNEKHEWPKQAQQDVGLARKGKEPDSGENTDFGAAIV